MSRPACRGLGAVGLALIAACGSPDTAAPTGQAGTSVDSLLARGEQVYLRGEFDSAAVEWNAALAQSRALGDSLSEARSLTWLGLAAWRQGDYRTARRLGEEALALKRHWALGIDLFKSYNALGLLAWNEGRLTEAMELFGQASAAARSAEDRKGIAAASGNLALVLTELGEFEEARRGFDSMRVAGQALADARIEGNALTNLGMLAVRVGDPASAIPMLEQARARYASIGYATGEQNALGQLGTAYAALGRPHLALRALDSALALSRRQGLRQEEASNLEAMAELYRDAGDVRRALELYAQAEPINRELGLVVEAGADLRSEAEIQGELGAMEKATAAAGEALGAHRAAGARFEELSDLLLLSDLAARSGDTASSASRLAAARKLARSLGVRRARAEVALAEARIADRGMDSRRALRALNDARLDLADGGYGIEQEALRLEARALAQLGRLDSAAAVGRRAVAALERVRGSYGSGLLRTSYLAGKQGAYTDLAEVLRRQGRTEEALEVVDAARGRALVEGLAAARGSGSPTGVTDRVLRQGDELLREIDALTEQLRVAEVDAAETPDSGASSRIGFLGERLAGHRREYEELAIRHDELRSPEATLLGVGWTTAAAVLSRLAADEALVEYQVADDSLLIFVGRRTALTVTVVPLPPGGLQGRVRLARELVARRDAGIAGALPILAGLGDLLIAGVRRAGGLEGARQLVIVPHGILTYLPFAALVNSETGRYLAQDFRLLTLPSAASIVALREGSAIEVLEAPPSVFAPRPDLLPETAPEAQAVTRALPGARLIVGRRAGEPGVRAALAGGGIVHLATHGELNPRNPMFSRLATAPGRSDDPADNGWLEVHEVLGISVRSSLVFLSGCETGLGAAWSTEFAAGEDFATLARAFLYAGARNVVATLWRVDDRGAAEFATRFYRHFPAVPAAEALALAQRDMLAGSRWRSPYHWAGYVVSGEGGEVRGAQKEGTLSVR
ncbi:MAG TPA: CHAT domain-containing tetratricopeptide repeat protein [Gemmatimonadales bacterium]